MQMGKAMQYIVKSTTERVRSRGLIRSVAMEAARIQREETIESAIAVFKQMCPSKVSKGCANVKHKNDTQSTRCDGNCLRIKRLVNGVNEREAQPW